MLLQYLYAIVEGLPHGWRPPPPVVGERVDRRSLAGLVVLSSAAPRASRRAISAARCTPESGIGIVEPGRWIDAIAGKFPAAVVEVGIDAQPHAQFDDQVGKR